MKEKQRERKVRSDKKRACSPTISVDLYDCVARISYICDRPLKEIGEQLCDLGLESKKVVDQTGIHFRRDFWWTDTVVLYGVTERESYRDPTEGEKKRLAMRFSQKLFDRLTDLAYALDTRTATAAGILLEKSVHSKEITNRLIARYTAANLDSKKKRELKEVLRYINKHNQEEDIVTIPMLLNYILEDMQGRTRPIKEIVHEWLNKRG